MENCKHTTYGDKDFKSALALVEAASLFRKFDTNIHIHPSLKRKLAIEIAKRPELTSELFKSDFLDKLLKVIINEHKVS